MNFMMIIGLAGCAGDDPPNQAAALPQWTWHTTMVFPADRSLTRPEDGIALPDGRLIVADQVHGLRLIELDGTHRPFGNLAAAGCCASGLTSTPAA